MRRVSRSERWRGIEGGGGSELGLAANLWEPKPVNKVSSSVFFGWGRNGSVNFIEKNWVECVHIKIRIFRELSWMHRQLAFEVQQIRICMIHNFSAMHPEKKDFFIRLYFFHKDIQLEQWNYSWMYGSKICSNIAQYATISINQACFMFASASANAHTTCKRLVCVTGK